MDIATLVFGAAILALLFGAIILVWTYKCREVWKDDRSIIRPVLMWGFIAFIVCIFSPIIPTIIGLFVGILIVIAIDCWHEWEYSSLKLFAIGAITCIIITIVAMMIFTNIPYTEEKVLTKKIDIVSVHINIGSSDNLYYVYQYSDGQPGMKADSVYGKNVRAYTNSTRSEIDFYEQRKVRNMSTYWIIFPFNDGIWVDNSYVEIYTPQATI